MNFEQARELLHDYVDHSLSEEQRQELERFLRQSRELRRELASLRHLLDLASNLNREVEPTRDLWPDIAEALSSQSRVGSIQALATRGQSAANSHGPMVRLSRWFRAWPSRPAETWRPLFAAAAVLALILMVALYQRSGNRRLEVAGYGDSTTQSWQADATLPVLNALALECNPVSIPAISHLGSTESWMSTDSQGLIAYNLRIVDLALAEVYEAWAANPQSRSLTRMLTNAYRTKADLQIRATELATQI